MMGYIFMLITAAFMVLLQLAIRESERYPKHDGCYEMDCLMDEYMDYLEDVEKHPPFEGYEFLSFDAWYHETYCTLKLPPAQVVPQVYR